jgi:cytochrome-b5 reductase
MPPKLATAATVAGVTVVGAYSIHAYLNRTSFAETDEPPMVFNGRIGFTSLSLHSVKAVSHDTKRLVFELPDRNARSGLTLTCTFFYSVLLCDNG